MKNIALSILLLLVLCSFSFAQVSGPVISDMKVVPDSASPGSIVVISCEVTHPNGAAIERVAASAHYDNLNASYQMLYDDGTHGDITAGDGTYSLELYAPNIAGDLKILFQAVDVDRNDAESDPIMLTIQ